MTETMLLDAFRRTVPAGALQIVGADDALGLPIAELPDGSRARIDLRWAGLGFPRDVAAALGRTTRKADDTVLVVCAQALSDGSRRLLDELGVSWFGLDGAASLHIGTIWVARDARAAPPASSVDFRWSAARADVAEVLLEIVAGGAAWQDGRPRVADVETLSRLSGRSLGSVSGTLAGLDTSGWTEPGPEPRSRAVADPSGLLDSWSGWQRRLPSTWASFHVLDRNPTRIEEQLASLFGSGLILTGSAVSERVRPMLTGMRPVTAYVDMDGPALDAAAARAQMLPAPAGSIRLRPAPSAVANTSRVVDGRREASPIRVYADLLAGSERDQEAADAYRSVELSVFA